MAISKKAVYGIIGATAAGAALGWYLLPKDSKIRKAIGDNASALGDFLKQYMYGETAGKKSTASSRV